MKCRDFAAQCLIWPTLKENSAMTESLKNLKKALKMSTVRLGKNHAQTLILFKTV